MSERGGAFLEGLSQASQERFASSRQLLSFAEYLDLVAANPTRFARNSAQYLIDAIEHWGSDKASDDESPRWRAFDAPWDDGEDRVVGHEAAQAELLRVLRNFVSQRRINRLVLLHGPNGSAKSSFVACLMRLLEAYSQTDEGALYRFVWVFAEERSGSARIGFGSRTGGDRAETLAHLPEDEIDVKLPAEQNDNPLYLLARAERERFLTEALASSPAFVLSDTIRRGDLGPRSRAIFEALLQAYRGDLARVYRHVQVERFTISRRYRRAAVTVEPQLHVDAGARQLTVDRSLGALPPVLQSQTLFEPHGALVEGNRGLIEYNDLLKRPMDANKYLLATSEKGTVALDIGELHVDALLVATANETYLEAFRQAPDWASYRGRFELIRMPYLLDVAEEQSIYDDLVSRLAEDRRPAPHTTWIVALWAVLTRLRRPDSERFARPTRDLVAALTPLQKAMLYAGEDPPGTWTAEQRRELRAAAAQMRRDGAEGAAYEGRFGASAREMKGVLLNAASAADGAEAPRAVLAELERLARDSAAYEWLRLEPDGEYHRPDRFVSVVREAYLDRVEREVRAASGLVDEAEYGRVFERYVQHANAWLRGEKLADGRGRDAAPDESMLADVEKRIGRDAPPKEFRGALISRIAAFRIDNPDAPVDLTHIFPHYVDRLRDEYYRSRQRELGRRCRALLDRLDGAEKQPAAEAAEADALLDRLTSDAGYTRPAARAAVAMLASARYRDASP